MLQQWGKAVNNVETAQDGTVTATFDDGTSYEGSLAVACDGGSSRIRALLFPEQQKYHIPVRLLGVKIDCTPEEIEPLRKLDPFFLQGAASQNDSFVYISGEFHSTYLLSCVVHPPFQKLTWMAIGSSRCSQQHPGRQWR